MLELDELLGHEEIKKSLKELLREENLPSPILFTGPPGVGKEHFARAFARAVLTLEKSKQATKLNLHHFSPQGKGVLYPITLIKEAIDAITQPPFEAKRKVVVLDQAERMQPVSANALLKTLEEPPSHSLIILTASREETLLPTLRSRCFELSFDPLSEEELQTYLTQKCKKSEQEARRIAMLAHGSLARLEALASDEENAFFHLMATLGAALVSKNHLELTSLFTKLDELIAAEPSITRPLRLEEACFALFYWYRDLELLAIKGKESHLFFYDHKELLAKCLPLPRPSLEKIGEKMERMQKALEFHIKLSHALETFL